MKFFDIVSFSLVGTSNCQCLIQTWDKRTRTIKVHFFKMQLLLDVRIILCLMSSGVFVHTFALAFRKMSSAIAKAGPSKEAAPVLETPEKD